jgi:tetratricopeptide (TPR) repeat protein
VDSGKANVLYDQQKYDEALQYYDKVLAIDPSNVDALNGKRFALANLDKSE